jgi:dihydrofolate synthase / folylpolyglutamate synthase
LPQAPDLSSQPAGRAQQILGRLEVLGIRLGLDSMRGLLAALGDPQRRFPAVLIAGSNGKGSTSALLASMVAAAGYRTGLYTSPHLEVVEERLRLDGRAIDEAGLGELLATVVSCAEREQGHSPTYFEAVTAAAFLWFAAEAVDLAIVEVGMGGRLDATNLCEPLLSLITSISLEHREHLGNTVAEIAGEKAGILRRGRPALSWVEDPAAAAAIRSAARVTGARLHVAQSEVRIEECEDRGWDGQEVTLVTPIARHWLSVSLPGRHQRRNLGLAVRAAEMLAGLGFAALGPDAVARGAAACRWPGRGERVRLPDGRQVLLDAAHNAEGAAVLAELLAAAALPGGGADMVFGVLGDKDAGEMLGLLLPHLRRLVLTTAPSPRARPVAELQAIVSGAQAAVQVLVAPEPEDALERALNLGGETLVICGSIFLVGDLRRRLRERFGVPAPASDLL